MVMCCVSVSASLQRMRDDMYRVSAFAPELRRQNSGDPLGLSPPSRAAIHTMADVEVRQREERRMRLELAAAQQDYPEEYRRQLGGGTARLGSTSPNFKVMPHVRSAPPAAIPCAW